MVKSTLLQKKGQYVKERAVKNRPGSKPFDQAIILLVLTVTVLVPFIHARPLFDFLTVPKVIALWLFGAAVFFCFAIKSLVNKEMVVPVNFLFLAPFIYLVFAIISTIFSVNPGISLVGTRSTYMGLLTYTSAIGLFVGGYVLGENERYHKTFLRLVTGVAVISGIIGWLQYGGWQYPFSFAEWGNDRVGGLIGNPSNFGGYLALLSPLTLGYFFCSDNFKDRIFAGLSSVFVLISLYLGKSSTALAVGPLIIFAMLIKTQIAKKGRSFLWASVLVLLLTVLPALTVLVFLAPSDLPNIASRFTLWRAGVAIAAAKPLTGAGLDTLRYVTSRFAEPHYKLPEEFMGDLHNLVLNQAATVGLLGAAVLIIFIAVLIAKGWTRGGYFELGLAGSALSFFLISMTTPEYPPFAVLFWTTAGILTSRLLAGCRRVIISNPAWLGFVLLVAGTMLLANFNYSARLGAAEYWHKQAADSNSAGASIDLAGKATSALPYYDYYYGYLATKAVMMSKQVDRGFLPIVKLAGEKAVRINKLESKNYESLGFYYLLLNQDSNTLRQGERNFKLAVDRNPYNLEAIYGLSETYFKLKKDIPGRYWRSRLKRYVGPGDQRVAELDKF